MSKALVCPVAAAGLLLGAGLASAQTTAPKSTTNPPATTTPADRARMTLTDAQAKSWVDKPIYSSDNKEVGEVVAFKRGADNIVTEMHADIGGMMGIGESRVKLTPQQFKLQNDRVVLNLTQEQAKNLPKVEANTHGAAPKPGAAQLREVIMFGDGGDGHLKGAIKIDGEKLFHPEARAHICTTLRGPSPPLLGILVGPRTKKRYPWSALVGEYREIIPGQS